jgi:hypothetical protein
VCNDCGCDSIQKAIVLNAVDAPELPALKVYPNPAEALVRIEATTGEVGEIALLNMAGVRLHPEVVQENGAATVDVSDLIPGVYVIEATLSGRIARMRLVVK